MTSRKITVYALMPGDRSIEKWYDAAPRVWYESKEDLWDALHEDYDSDSDNEGNLPKYIDNDIVSTVVVLRSPK